MEHGTVQRYRKHLRDGDDPCDPCRAAQARYMVEYRLGHPRNRSAESKARRIRQRALRRLGQEYPARLEALMAEEAAR